MPMVTAVRGRLSTSMETKTLTTLMVQLSS